jgi:hypothetical protein
MNTEQRNLNISFRGKDVHLLYDLKRISEEKFMVTSRVVIDLIKKGMLYDEMIETLNETKDLEKNETQDLEKGEKQDLEKTEDLDPDLPLFY